MLLFVFMVSDCLIIFSYFFCFKLVKTKIGFLFYLGFMAICLNRLYLSSKPLSLFKNGASMAVMICKAFPFPLMSLGLSPFCQKDRKRKKPLTEIVTLHTSRHNHTKFQTIATTMRTSFRSLGIIE